MEIRMESIDPLQFWGTVSLRDRSLLAIAIAATLLLDAEEPGEHSNLHDEASALDRALAAGLLDHEHPTARHPLLTFDQHLSHRDWAQALGERWPLPFAEVATLALRILEHGVRTRATEASAAGPAASRDEPVSAPGPLSKRELMVLRLVAQGYRNKSIARELAISRCTVNYHLTSIFHKLGVDTRAQAVAVAAERHYL